MRVAGLQHDIVWEDAAATRQRLEPQVTQAVDQGARLVVLTEMFATGFSMRTHLTAEPVDGPTSTWMQEQAERHGVWLAGSVAIRDAADELPTNSLLVHGPDGTLARYDKIHPFSYAGEHERFRPGQSDVTVAIDGVRFGLTVCYDLRFADQYWRSGPDVEAFLVVANWPASRREHWNALLPARAVENQVFVVGINRVGSGGKLRYAGDSRIFDPAGESLAEGDADESILMADINPERVLEIRSKLPFLADR